MNYFEKKQWIRIAVCAVLLLAVTLVLSGVFTKQELVFEPSAVPAGSGQQAEAAEQGFGGDVTVHVGFDSDLTVQSLSIDTPNETEGLGKRASEEAFTAQFVGKAAPFAFGENGIEALSGATVTSNAAIKAINRAVTGEDASAEAETTAEPAAPTTETAETPTESAATSAETAENLAEAAEQGFGGDVTVHVGFDSNKAVQSLSIDTPNETEGLGKRASEEAFTAQFIGKTAPFAYGENGIEALTGATVTSEAAIKAINRAVTGDDASAEVETPAESADSDAEEKTEQADGKGKSEEAATEPEQKTEQADAKTAEPVIPAFAGYRADADNAFSHVTVIASAKNGTLSSVKILSSGEQDLMTDEIRNEWAKAILESGNAAPDAVTGATLAFSAQSVQEAAGKILESYAVAAPAMETKEAAAPAENAEPEPAAEEEAKEEPAEEVQTEEAKTEEPRKEETAEANGQAYGSYRVTKENMFSKVTVSASAKNGKLTDVKITSAGEQDLLTDEIRNEWAKAILESGSATPDTITGATLVYSAQSVQEAAEELLGMIAAPVADVAETETTAGETKEEPAEEVKTEEPKAEEPKKDEPAEANGQAYGSYRVTKENMFSKVTVSASTKNGKLTDVKITSDGEQDLLTDEIRNEWAKAILESGNAAPDAITGATLVYSAQSVQEAAEEILGMISAPAADGAVPEAAEEPAETEPATAEPQEAAHAEEAEGATQEQSEAESAGNPVEASQEEPKEEPKGETPIPVYGAYRVDRENAFSRISLIATAKNGKLTGLKILSEGEQDLLTDEIRNEWAKAILESGSATPDAITGATLVFSAQSVQEAAAEILEKVSE